MNEWGLFQVGASLLAFVIAFYALAARERRTPLIVNSVFYVFYVVFASVLLVGSSRLLSAVQGWYGADASPFWSRVPRILDLLAILVLVGGAVVVFDRIWSLHNQHKNFRTDARAKNIEIVRKALFQWKMWGKRPKTYTHDPVPFSEQLLATIQKSPHLPTSALAAAVQRSRIDSSAAHSMCAAFRVLTLSEADEIAADLASRFLEEGCFVQYSSCGRHPIEFWTYLQASWGQRPATAEWADVSANVVLIDAFSPHFGFTDSVHRKMTWKAEEDGATVIASSPSFAGLHTATMKAFNHTKTQQGGDRGKRRPTLVIYEGTHALVELESIEQYRVFMRHVLPSERLWGGMFTLLIESSISTQDMSIVRSYADVFVDSAAIQTSATTVENVE
jgi:hypothetical protein